MSAILLHALAVHAIAAGHLTTLRALRAMPARRGSRPRAAGPAGAGRQGQHHPGLGQMGRADLRRRRPAAVRREDGDRPPRSRASLAADGASGIVWVLGGLSLVAASAGIVAVFL